MRTATTLSNVSFSFHVKLCKFTHHNVLFPVAWISCNTALGPGITVGTGPTDGLDVGIGGSEVLVANDSIIVAVYLDDTN